MQNSLAGLLYDGAGLYIEATVFFYLGNIRS